MDILTVLAVFSVDNGGKLVRQVLGEFPQVGNVLTVGLSNIEKLLCRFVLTEYGDTMLTLVYKPTQLVSRF